MYAHEVLSEMSGLKNMNLMDDETAIDLLLGDPEDDKIKCPDRNYLIKKSECLDYSGSHFDECNRCNIGNAVKAKLCPIK